MGRCCSEKKRRGRRGRGKGERGEREKGQGRVRRWRGGRGWRPGGLWTEGGTPVAQRTQPGGGHLHEHGCIRRRGQRARRPHAVKRWVRLLLRQAGRGRSTPMAPKSCPLNTHAPPLAPYLPTGRVPHGPGLQGRAGGPHRQRHRHCAHLGQRGPRAARGRLDMVAPGRSRVRAADLRRAEGRHHQRLLPRLGVRLRRV